MARCDLLHHTEMRPEVSQSALEPLIQALEMGGSNRRTNLDDLRIQILAGYQPFDPARHNIGAWTAGFKRLVPDDASDER